VRVISHGLSSKHAPTGARLAGWRLTAPQPNAFMSEPKEPLGEKVLVAFVQTLVFGALLAVFGYWLNLRLEDHKNDLAAEMESTKIVFETLKPDIQERRTAYLKLQQAMRELKYTLEVYYHRGNDPTEEDVRERQIAALTEKLGLGSGGGSSTWVTHGDALEVVKKVDDLRKQYADILSPEIRVAVARFRDVIVHDLEEGAKPSSDNETFHREARTRLRTECTALNDKIVSALQLHRIPLK
jgi:hypothetical protein